MARIPDAELERLKHEVSLVRLIEGQGITLATQGKDLACRCPWHEGDDTPSCVITPKSNLWHCFACNAGGTVIDWVMRSHKVSFRHACELLLKEHPSLAASVSSSVPARKVSAGKLRSAQSLQYKAGAQMRTALQRVGILRDSGHEHLNGLGGDYFGVSRSAVK